MVRKWSHFMFSAILFCSAFLFTSRDVHGEAPQNTSLVKAAQYQEEQAEIKREAEHKQAEAKANFHKHEVFARSVTMFQIAIAIAAISALTKKRRFWFVSLVFGLAGVIFLVLGSLAH